MIAIGAFVLAATTATAGTDLSSILAPAPSADWVERSPNVVQLVGPFTARDYGAFENDNGASVRALGRYGFTSGYDRDFEQKVTQDYLSEAVFEFGSATGASNWFSDLKVADQTDKSYLAEIPSLAGATSFGDKADNGQGGRSYRIYFVKGNLEFVVDMESDTNDLSGAVLSQAQVQYDMAPAMTVVGTANNGTASGNAVALIFIVVVGLATSLLYAVNRRRRSARMSAGPYSIQMSPDGNYWWDGQRWRLTSTDPPPIHPS